MERQAYTIWKSFIDIAELFSYELSPVPSSLFDEYGDMRKGNKAVLVKKIAVFAPTPLSLVDAELVDGNEAIFHTFWPKNSTMEQFAKSFVPGLCESIYQTA